MGELRDYRLLIPGAVLLLAFGLPVLLCTTLVDSWWTGKDSGALLSAIIALVVTSLAGGFLCGSVTVLFESVLTYGSPLGKLRASLGMEASSPRAEVLAEAHLRFHSHAPEPLLKFAARRLITMYTAWNSVVALLFGYTTAMLVATTTDHPRPDLSPVAWGWMTISLMLLAVVLLFVGGRAYWEHWEAFCKFMIWDRDKQR